MINVLVASTLLLTPLLVSAEPVRTNVAGMVVTVGSDAACDYADLTQATLLAGSSNIDIRIRVAKNVGPRLHVLSVHPTTSIVGGFDTCSDTTASGRTVIAGNGGPGSVLSLAASFDRFNDFTVNLKNLEIRDGIGEEGRGGGMTIDGPFQVFLDNTVVQNNSSVRGGGVYIKGSAGQAGANELTQVVLLNESYIQSNIAQSGGGIACEGKANVLVYDAGVYFNTADVAGAGISSLRCHVTIHGRAPPASIADNGRGVNVEPVEGGGIYAESSIIILRGGGPGRVAVVGGNVATRGGGIYLRNNSQLHAYDAQIIQNSARVGGGVYAENSAIVISRTRSGADCHDEFRCSELSRNQARAVGSKPDGGGGGLFAMGGTTLISGTFIENNLATGGRGMAVRVDNAPGSSFGADRNGLRILGSVVAGNTRGVGKPADYTSVIEFRGSRGAVGFSTFTANHVVPQIVYTPFHGWRVDIYGNIFDSSMGVAAGPGTVIPIPNGDCNRLYEAGSPFSANSMRSTLATPDFVDPSNGDYRLAGLNLVDRCDASYDILSSELSADGGQRPYDDPDTTGEFGNYDLGGLERHPADMIFRDGLE